MTVKLRFLPVLLTLAVPAMAQPAPKGMPAEPQLPQPATEQANEAIILEQLTARRDWQARAVSLQNWGQALAKQNEQLRTDLNKAQDAVKAAQAETNELKGRMPPEQPEKGKAGK
jgi:small-conductance mechanosensitive channel